MNEVEEKAVTKKTVKTTNKKVDEVKERTWKSVFLANYNGESEEA